jgi:hypothetical protein
MLMYPLGGSDLLLPVVALSEDETGAFPFEEDANDADDVDVDVVAAAAAADTFRCC